MTEQAHVNLTGASLLAAALAERSSELEAGAQRCLGLTGLAGLDPGGPAALAAAAAALATEAVRVRALLAEVRAIDAAGGPVVWQSADHPSWHDPAVALAAAQAAAAELAQAFEWGLGDGASDRLVGLLAEHEGDPVFALELWRIAGGATAGFGAALWAASAAPLDRRGEVHGLFRALGNVIAVANRAAPDLVTYEAVVERLGRATEGDAGRLAQIPLIFLASRPFTASFLRPAWTQLVLQPNRLRQVAGRALPADFVHDGRAQHDVRSLVLQAVARNPVAAARFLGGADLHGTPNLERLVGPGVMDGDEGRTLAAVIRAGTLPWDGPVPAWQATSDAERGAAASAVVTTFGERAHLLGWHLPDGLRPALVDMTVAHLPSFRLVPESWRAVGWAPPPAGELFTVDREVGLQHLSLLFTRPDAEQAVVQGAADLIEQTAASPMAAASVSEVHRGLGLLWGAVTDATVGGRLLAALADDADRRRQRATFDLGQVGAVATATYFGGPLVGQAAEVVADTGQEVVIPELHKSDELHDAVQRIVEARGRRLHDLISADGFPSPALDAAGAGFLAGFGPVDEPPGYVEPGPSTVERVATLVGAVDPDLAVRLPVQPEPS